MHGKEIPPPILPEIVLFNLCEGMKWNHLPEPGGLYAQSPKLIDRFHYLFTQRSLAEAEKQAKREREMGPRGKKPVGRSNRRP